MDNDISLPSQNKKKPGRTDEVQLPGSSKTSKTTVLPGQSSSALQKKIATTEIKGESLKERITFSTLAGGLKEIPKGFDDRTGDWQAILSKNPFDILFLDFREIVSISDDVVEKNYKALGKFWEEKQILWGTGSAKDQLESKFGKEILRDAPKIISAAYNKLKTPDKRQSVADEYINMLISCAEKELAGVFKIVLENDGILNSNEIEQIFKFAGDIKLDNEKINLTEEEIAQVIIKKINEFKLVPFPESADKSLSLKNQLTSVDWTTEERKKEELSKEFESNIFGKKITNRTDLANLLYNEMFGKNKAELIDYLNNSSLTNSPKINLELKKIFLGKRSKDSKEFEKKYSNLDDTYGYLNVMYYLNNNLPYALDNQNVAETLDDLAEIIYRSETNLTKGSEQLKKGYLHTWISRKDREVAGHLEEFILSDYNSNSRVPIYNAVFILKPTLPFIIDYSKNISATTPKELSEILFYKYFKQGFENFFNGYYSIWLKAKDRKLYNQVIKIIEDGGEKELTFLRFIYTLNPGLPFKFDNNTFVKTPLELSEQINKSFENWENGITELYSGSITTWLEFCGYNKIAKEWEKVKYVKYNDISTKNLGMEFFVQLLNNAIEKPKLFVEPKEIRLGKLESKSSKTIGITLKNENRGYLYAKISINNPQYGIKVSLEEILLSRFENSTAEMEVVVDTTNTPAGTHYSTSLNFECSDGTVVSVPISFKVTFPRTLFILYSILYGVVGALILYLTRFVLSNNHPPDWFNKYILFYPTSEFVKLFSNRFLDFGIVFGVSFFIVSAILIRKTLKKRLIKEGEGKSEDDYKILKKKIDGKFRFRIFLLIILLAVGISSPFLNTIGFYFYYSIDNLLCVANTINPLIIWSVFGIICGVLCGNLKTVKKLQLTKKITFISISMLFLFLSLCFFISHPDLGDRNKIVKVEGDNLKHAVKYNFSVGSPFWKYNLNTAPVVSLQNEKLLVENNSHDTKILFAKDSISLPINFYKDGAINDFSLEYSVKAKGTGNFSYGIVFAAFDDNNYYFCTIDNKNNYEFGKCKNGVINSLANKKLPHTNGFRYFTINYINKHVSIKNSKIKSNRNIVAPVEIDSIYGKKVGLYLSGNVKVSLNSFALESFYDFFNLEKSENSFFKKLYQNYITAIKK